MPITIEKTRVDMSDIRGLGRAVELERQAKALKAEADSIREQAAGQIGDRLPCPPWCAADDSASASSRQLHEWAPGSSADKFLRHHRGTLNGRVVESVEVVSLSGEHWFGQRTRFGKGAAL